MISKTGTKVQATLAADQIVRDFVAQQPQHDFQQSHDTSQISISNYDDYLQMNQSLGQEPELPHNLPKPNLEIYPITEHKSEETPCPVMTAKTDNIDASPTILTPYLMASKLEASVITTPKQKQPSRLPISPPKPQPLLDSSFVEKPKISTKEII